MRFATASYRRDQWAIAAPRGVLKGLGLLSVALPLTLPLNAAPVPPGSTPDVSAKIISWAQDNIFAYKAYIQYANHAPAAQVPVPPMVDPPCHVCGDSTQTQGEAQVAAWVTQSQKPEVDDIVALLKIAHDLALWNGVAPSTITAAAQRALGQFSDSDIDAAAIKLANRLLNDKAIPMANKYDKEPKQAYAGSMLLLAIGKDTALINGLPGGSSDNGSDQVIPLVQTWTQSIVDKIDNDVLSGHKYNLCPVYASLYRQVELLGGPSTNMDQFTQTMQKLQNQLHFNIKLNLHATGGGGDGGQFDITWGTTAKLKLNLDLANSCYTPQFENGGNMAVNVQSFTMYGMETEPDGSKQKIPVTLTSSHSYNVPLGSPVLNLCDPSPVLQIPFGNNFPSEEIEAKGHRSKTELFGGFLMSVVTLNNVNSAQTNAVTGNSQPPPSVASSSQPSAASQGMQSAQSQLEAHKGDMNWLMSAQGQAAIAQIQKDAMTVTTQAMAAKGVSLPQAGNLAQMMAATGSALLPWTNGSAQVANKTFHVDKDSAHYTLTATVQQQSQ